MRENIRKKIRRRGFCTQKMVATKTPGVVIHFQLRAGDFDEGVSSFYADRAAGCDRDHRDFGSDASACPESRQGDGAGDFLPEQSQAMGTGDASLRNGSRGFFAAGRRAEPDGGGHERGLVCPVAAGIEPAALCGHGVADEYGRRAGKFHLDLSGQFAPQQWQQSVPLLPQRKCQRHGRRQCGRPHFNHPPAERSGVAV
jgi:hypothetical protein